MATGTLTGQTIANTYKALLKITGTTAGGETLHATTQKVIEDGDGNPFPFSAAQDAILMIGTRRIEFNDSGEYISGDGTDLTITSGRHLILATAAGGSVYYGGSAGTSNTVFGKSAAASIDAGSNYNVFIGEGVSDATMNDAINNVGVGYNSLGALTTGDYNVAIGDNALLANQTGEVNIAVGTSALRANTASQNTAVGGNAMYANVGGENNVAVGHNALDANISGDINVAVGKDALGAYIGNAAVAVGREALRDLNHADALGTVGIGQGAGAAITSGQANTVIGYQAANDLTTGDFNTVLGYQALDRATTAALRNVAIGHQAMHGNLTTAAVVDCVAIGVNALEATLTADASGTIAIGKGALTALTSGARNIGIGFSTGLTLTSSNDCIFIGYEAGKDCDSTGSTPAGCIYVGTRAGENLDDGTQNVAIGHQAMRGNTENANTPNNSVAIGFDAMKNVTDGDDNVVIGFNAGPAMTVAGQNVFIGKDCAEATNEGDYNTVVGHGAYKTAAGNSANYNTVVGWEAGKILSSGDENTCVGAKAGDLLTTGHNCTIIGHGADGSANNADNQIAIGHNLIAHGDNKFTFGDGSGDNRVHNTFTSNATFTRVSDKRYKKEIKDNTDAGLDFINDLRTVTFKKRALSEIDKNLPDYDETKTEPRHKDKLYGVIAQEVKEVLDNHNITDFGGWDIEERTGIQSIAQSMFVYPLIKAVQELSKQVKEQAKRIKELEN